MNALKCAFLTNSIALKCSNALKHVFCHKNRFNAFINPDLPEIQYIKIPIHCIDILLDNLNKKKEYDILKTLTYVSNISFQ